MINEQISPLSKRAVEWTLTFEDHVNRRRIWYMALISLTYFAMSAGSALRKPLWYDELFTYALSRLPSCQAIWIALSQGADIHAPLDYWLRHLSMKWLGAGDFAFRLPSLVAFWVCLACLYRFVSVRTSPFYGLFATLIPFSTIAYKVSHEGRMYAILLGWCGLALMSWQAAEGKWRRVMLLLLGFSLAAAIYTHYYGVLLSVVIGIGEIARIPARRKVDRALLAVVVGAPAAALVSLIPLIMAAREFAPTFWTPVSFTNAINLYPLVFHKLVVPTLVLVAVSATAPFMRGIYSKITAPPAHELVLGMAFLAWPLFVYVLAVLVTHALWFRYALPAALGLAILAPYGLRLLARAQPFAPIAMAAIFFLMMLGVGASYHAAHKGEQNLITSTEAAMTTAVKSTGPAVIANGELFLQLQRYLSPELAQKIVYLYDVNGPSGEIFYDRLRTHVPVNILSYEPFVRENPDFLLYLPNGAPGEPWLTQRLLKDGFTLTVADHHQDQPVYRVSKASR